MTIGTKGDVEATGNGSVIAILKRLRTLWAGGLPAALGAGGGLKVEGVAGGVEQPASVADGSDVTQGALADAGVSTDAAGTVSAKLRGLVILIVNLLSRWPASLGQKTKAASMAVTLASDEDAIALAGGETHIGSIGGNTVVAVQTPTVTVGAYSAKDAVGGLLTFADAARVSGGAITIQAVVVSDLAAQSAGLVLALYDRTFTNTADNAAFDPSDADALNCIGYVAILASDYVAFADNAIATVRNIGLPAVLNGTSLFGQLMCTGTPTYAGTSDMQVTVGIFQE